MKWPLLRARLIAYWDRKRGDRATPSRQDIDPLDIGRLLPHVALVDVLNGATDFRYRLLGEHIIEQTGQNLSGKMIDTSGGPKSAEAQLHARCVTAASQLTIETLETEFTTSRGVTKRLSVVIMPLSPDGQEANMLFGGVLVE